MTTTSAMALQEITSHGTKADQQDKALALVLEYPFRTARELSRKVGPEVITHEALHKRLPELRRKGLVVNASIRVCTVTGKYAKTWIVSALAQGCE